MSWDGERRAAGEGTADSRCKKENNRTSVEEVILEVVLIVEVPPSESDESFTCEVD